MGKVVVHVKLENDFDVTSRTLGRLEGESVRTEEIDDTLVDTGATGLCAPWNVIERLGVLPHGTRRLRSANGTIVRNVYGGVRLTIQDREFLCDITEVPDDCPVLIGQIPLEGLDFVVDPEGRKLIGNPAHGGVAMHEAY